MSDTQYSVNCEFSDGTQTYTKRWVTVEEATGEFEHVISSVAAKTGLLKRVIITDGGDMTNAIWEQGKGIVYPTPEDLKKAGL